MTGRVRASARLLALALGAGMVASPCFAGEPGADLPDTSTAEVQRCVEAHDNARVLMLEEKWLEAREGMVRCQEAACPLAIRSDCAAWLEEVTRILPTLLVVVERDDDGKARVELEIDGRSVELPNPPQPLEVLPGTHLIKVHLEPYARVERVVVLSKGEKNHVVRVRFVSERPAPTLPPPSPPKPERSRPIPVATYALAGGAVAALGTSGILLASALTSRQDALDRCAPICSEDERESIDARLLAADIFGGVGLVLGGFAVYTFVTRPTVEERAALLPKLEISRNSSRLSVEGSF
jgi:hypothetical protein